MLIGLKGFQQVNFNLNCSTRVLWFMDVLFIASIVLLRKR